MKMYVEDAKKCGLEVKAHGWGAMRRVVDFGFVLSAGLWCHDESQIVFTTVICVGPCEQACIEFLSLVVCDLFVPFLIRYKK